MTTKKKKNDEQEITGLFAFWRYDLYPYVLGGVAERMDDDGRVYVRAYQGWVKPIKLMPIKKGKALLDALKGHPHGLEAQRRADLEKFEEKWDDTLFALFPEARHPNISRHNKDDKT